MKHTNKNIGGGAFEDGEIFVHCPTSLDLRVVKAILDDEGNIDLVIDDAKVQAKTDQAWLDVRVQQRDLLYKSDWTCSVTDYEVPNKSEWRALRSRRGAAPGPVPSRAA